MSYSMTVSVSAPPSAAAVLRQLGAAVEVREELPAGSWPEGILHLHHVGKSTRGVEVALEDRELSVRMLACANREDWELAFRLLEAIGAREIAGEDGTSAPLSALRTRFEQVMVRDMAFSLSSLRVLIEKGNELQFQGSVRDVFFGPRMLRDLGSNPLRWLDAIRRVQYVEQEGYEWIEYGDLGAAMGLRVDGVGFSIWDPMRDQAFAPTPYLAIAAPAGNIYLASSSLPELLGARFAWLDEKQFAIAATPDSELAQLFERAAAVTVDPYAELRRQSKRWWQFWKR